MQDPELKHLIKMVNQITANLARGADEETDIAKVADHLQRFWSPDMRSKLANFIEQDPQAASQLNKVSELAVQRVAE